MSFLAAFSEQIYGLMRIVVGFLFACHGAQKVFGMFGGTPPEAPAAVIWTAGPIELVGGVLIAVGLAAGPAAFVSSGLMAVAYFIGHQGGGLLPIQNHGELAALYSWVFLFIAARGSGALSVDAARRAG
jgi:putative oxidoreductase